MRFGENKGEQERRLTFMHKKDKLKNKVSSDEQADKTATDNQWVSVAGYKGYRTEEEEKTATDNQWTSTMKNT